MFGCQRKYKETDVYDTGGSGYGGFTFSKFERLICGGSFTLGERKQSSSFRELLAIKLVLQSYGKDFS